MRIVSSDSEPEELETAVVHSQVTLVPDTVSTPNEDNVVPEAKRVSVAWLCFDREKTYQKNGIDYVKCNQPRCGTEFKLNPTTSTNLSRHVQKTHPTLLPQKKADINLSKKTALSFSRKQMIIPSCSDGSVTGFANGGIIGSNGVVIGSVKSTDPKQDEENVAIEKKSLLSTGFANGGIIGSNGAVIGSVKSTDPKQVLSCAGLKSSLSLEEPSLGDDGSPPLVDDFGHPNSSLPFFEEPPLEFWLAMAKRPCVMEDVELNISVKIKKIRFE